MEALINKENNILFPFGKLERFWKPFEFKLDEANFQCVPFIKQKAFYYVSRISNLTLGTFWTSMKIKNSFVFTAFINQSWNFLNNLETHKIVLFCPLRNFKEFGNLGRVWLPLIGFQPLPYLLWPFNLDAHDALWKAKNENLAQILGVKSGLLQIYPTYKNLVPRFLE